MCNVNYLIEIRRFNTFAARTRLPASAQLLWYKLIEIMNQHAHGGDWCDGFLRIDNPYLLAYFPMRPPPSPTLDARSANPGFWSTFPAKRSARRPRTDCITSPFATEKALLSVTIRVKSVLIAQRIAPLIAPKSATIPVTIPILPLIITPIAPKSVTIPVIIRITQAFIQAIAQPFVQPIVQPIATEIRPISTALI
jgi:hypothetical protein